MEAIKSINLKTDASAINKNKTQSVGFQEVLDEAINFSKHANIRLRDRQIRLSPEQVARVDAGINEAQKKGVKDSLVIVDDVTLVVNIRSRTVITAIAHEKQRVFTNIDGAVIV